MATVQVSRADRNACLQAIAAGYSAAFIARSATQGARQQRAPIENETRCVAMIRYRGYRIDAVVADTAWQPRIEDPKGEPCPIASSSTTRQEALIAASLHVNTLIASTPKRWT